MLEELADDYWSWLWNLYSLGISAAGTQAEEVNEDLLGFGDGVTKRFAIAMTKRLAENADRRAVARRCFYNYEGGDRRVLQTAAEWEMFSEAEEEVDWSFVTRLSKLARVHGIRGLFSQSQVWQKVSVPLDVAVKVLEECESHNSQFVGMCERTFGSDVARRAPKVSTVAEEDMWFEGGTGA